ncbi:hypothetical protein XENTR_v10008000 [Xenopus tropicalis]|uniref:Uncharacterized transmembrane protein DDB_G0289901 n=1 Tax=Xenopus tropicalis TaxID=8364 RepID=A0A8J0QVY9_XENTR|nr:uncharacterized transmembrane protein DDB_G0289901 [Xenopus tropicalis]KAE8614127.1 hypothetical protein XENTR_v10008000 [Xenopus tropicalis]|eukprot:XP_002942474.2 PREDICTED: uncharacterized transmembrane protein DDB_G0289901-like [Xenopus tropicalis]
MIAVFLLLAAVSSYFTPATSQCLKQCVDNCSQTPFMTGYPVCVQNALATNKIGTISVVARVMCAFDRTKDTSNKVELVMSVNAFLNVTGCPRSLILGPRGTMDDLILDINGLLQNVLRISVNVLTQFNLGNLAIPPCGLLSNLLIKVDTILNIVADLPVSQITKIIGGGPAGALAILPAGLLDTLSHSVGNLVSNVGNIIAGLLNQVGSVVSGVPSIVSGAGGSQVWQTGSAGGTQGWQTGSAGGNLPWPAGSAGGNLAWPAGSAGGNLAWPAGSAGGNLPWPAGSAGGNLAWPVGSAGGNLAWPVGSAGGNLAWPVGSAGGNLAWPAGGPGTAYAVSPFDGNTYSNYQNVYGTGNSGSSAGTGTWVSWGSANTGNGMTDPSINAAATGQNINAGPSASVSSTGGVNLLFKKK